MTPTPPARSHNVASRTNQYAVAKDYLIPPETSKIHPGNTNTITDAGATRFGSLPEPVLQMMAGGVAGCAVWVPPVYFLDVVKTRMQTAEPGVYRNSWDCFRQTVR